MEEIRPAWQYPHRALPLLRKHLENMEATLERDEEHVRQLQGCIQGYELVIANLKQAIETLEGREE